MCLFFKYLIFISHIICTAYLLLHCFKCMLSLCFAIESLRKASEFITGGSSLSGSVLMHSLMATCICVFRNVIQEAEWKSHLAVIMKNGSVFILKWGVITGLSLETEWEMREWAGKGQRVSEERGRGKCASIIWRHCCVSCCGIGAGHYVPNPLENVELNTGRPW